MKKLFLPTISSLLLLILFILLYFYYFNKNKLSIGTKLLANKERDRLINRKKTNIQSDLYHNSGKQINIQKTNRKLSHNSFIGEDDITPKNYIKISKTKLS